MRKFGGVAITLMDKWPLEVSDDSNAWQLEIAARHAGNPGLKRRVDYEVLKALVSMTKVE
ncbi:hypothetical protein VB10N_11630 [Vibrio sp. 10N]|nr:hypothetical protein VB10N_11630 [Vibrio sp. 10N]